MKAIEFVAAKMQSAVARNPASRIPVLRRKREVENQRLQCRAGRCQRAAGLFETSRGKQSVGINIKHQYPRARSLDFLLIHSALPICFWVFAAMKRTAGLRRAEESQCCQTGQQDTRSLSHRLHIFSMKHLSYRCAQELLG